MNVNWFYNACSNVRTVIKLMSRSFYFLSNLSQHLSDGAPTASSSGSSLQMLSNAVCVYQPISKTQLVLPDASRCLAVRAFFRLIGVNFNLVETTNSHDASPSGTVPFIVADNGSLAVAEWKPIVAWAHMQGHRTQQQQHDRQSADVAVWSQAIDQPLRLAELQVTYEWEENFSEYAAPRIGSVCAWPLSAAIPRRRRNEALDELKASRELFAVALSQTALTGVDRLLTALDLRLKDKDDWLASTAENGPTEADCLLYGHLRAILDSPLPRDDLRQLVMSKPVLLKFCTRFQECLRAKGEGFITMTTERPATQSIISNGRPRTISRDFDQESEKKE